MMKTVAIFLALILTSGLCLASGDFHYDSGLALDSIDSVLKQNQLRPDENIKSVLLRKTDAVSVHLIQIRRAEKPHVHMTHDLTVFLKTGKGRLHLNGQVIELSEGDAAFIPSGAPHHFENTGAEPAVGIGIFAPPYDGRDTAPVDGSKSPH